MAFSGFPPAAIAFYEELAADNTRAFWQANKARYESDVKAPMLALLDELSEFGPLMPLSISAPTFQVLPHSGTWVLR